MRELNEDVVPEYISRRLSIRRSKLSPETTLLVDLGVDGDDAIEFIQEFGSQFSIDFSTFEAPRYFVPEASPTRLNSVWSHFATAKAELTPLTISDLLRAAATGAWTLDESTN